MCNKGNVCDGALAVHLHHHHDQDCSNGHVHMQDPQGQMNVVHILDNFHFRGHLCISFELLGQNLYDLMREQKFRGLHLQLVQQFARQMLTTLCFLKDEGIIHCDLKPENVLLQHSSSSVLKVRVLLLL
jgi:dual specificity tyrosine-phosphorylation-regulated kinase 2/3/4